MGNIDVKVTPVRMGNGDYYSLERNSLAKQLKDAINPAVTYQLFTTRANPEAIQVIAENDAMLTRARGLDMFEFNTCFDMDLMDAYLTVIEKMMRKEGHAYVQYGSVTVQGVHNSDRQHDQSTGP